MGMGQVSTLMLYDSENTSSEGEAPPKTNERTPLMSARSVDSKKSKASKDSKAPSGSSHGTRQSDSCVGLGVSAAKEKRPSRRLSNAGLPPHPDENPPPAPPRRQSMALDGSTAAMLRLHPALLMPSPSSLTKRV